MADPTNGSGWGLAAAQASRWRPNDACNTSPPRVSGDLSIVVDASSVPDDSGETSLRSAKILYASFPISLWVICSTAVKLEASRTRSPTKPYLHLPLFFATLSRYLSAYPWINFFLANLHRSLKCRCGPLALLVFRFLLFLGMKAVISFSDNK